MNPLLFLELFDRRHVLFRAKPRRPALLTFRFLFLLRFAGVLRPHPPVGGWRAGRSRPTDPKSRRAYHRPADRLTEPYGNDSATL